MYAQFKVIISINIETRGTDQFSSNVTDSEVRQVPADIVWAASRYWNPIWFAVPMSRQSAGWLAGGSPKAGKAKAAIAVNGSLSLNVAWLVRWEVQGREASLGLEEGRRWVCSQRSRRWPKLIVWSQFSNTSFWTISTDWNTVSCRIDRGHMLCYTSNADVWWKDSASRQRTRLNGWSCCRTEPVNLPGLRKSNIQMLYWIFLIWDISGLISASETFHFSV